MLGLYLTRNVQCSIRFVFGHFQANQRFLARDMVGLALQGLLQTGTRVFQLLVGNLSQSKLKERVGGLIRFLRQPDEGGNCTGLVAKRGLGIAQ